ncbi:EpsI family protein [candidate division KSB1 bacterium]|nr:EpsI family protein [candidate division KSB1 bacterium]
MKNFKNKEFVISVILIIATGVYVNIIKYSRVASTEVVDLEKFPEQLNNWKLIHQSTLSMQVQNVLKSDAQIMRKYVNSRGEYVWIFLAYFRDQKYGEQIHSPRHCLPGSGWNIRQNSLIKFSDAVHFNANRLVIQQNAAKEIMVYWFWTRNGIITKEYRLKFDLAFNSLLRKPTDAAFIRLNIRNSKNADVVISDFISDFFPHIKSVLPF